MIKRILKQTRSLDLTEGNAARSIWILAFPMMLGNILQTTFNMIDMIWVGRLGPETITAVAMGGVVIMPRFALANSAATLVGQSLGANKFSRAEPCGEGVGRRRRFKQRLTNKLSLCKLLNIIEKGE